MYEPEISFTILATPRPDLLYQTLSSFKENLKDIDISKCNCNIFVDKFINNIGPKPVECILVADKFFGSINSEVNESNFPSFPKGVKWLFEQNHSKYNFHLEDDWELLTPVSIKTLVESFDKKSTKETFGIYHKVSQVSLRAWPKKIENELFCLSPALHVGTTLNALSTVIKKNDNPEQSIRKHIRENMPNYFNYFPHDEVILKDTGREWMKINKYTKSNNKNFVRWSVDYSDLANQVVDQNVHIPEYLKANSRIYK